MSEKTITTLLNGRKGNSQIGILLKQHSRTIWTVVALILIIIGDKSFRPISLIYAWSMAA